MPRWNQTSTKNNQNGALVSEGTFRIIPCERGAKKERVWTSASLSFGINFDQQPTKIQSPNHQNQPKTWNLIPEGYQNGSQINAKSHQKSMPKLVAKKIKKVINIHAFSEW